MSSRNQRLSAAARQIAPALHTAMQEAAAALRAKTPAGTALDRARDAVIKAGFDQVEYIELRDADTLLPATDQSLSRRLLAAAWLDGVRLIDNIPV